MRKPACLLVLMLSSAVVTGECLTVKDQGWDSETTELGVLAVTWHGTLENTCDEAFDAEVMVHFTDTDEKSVYKVRDRGMLAARETVELGRRVYVPSRYADRIEGMALELTERQRPR